MAAADPSTSGASHVSAEAEQVEPKEDALERLFSLTTVTDSDKKLVRAAALELLSYGRQGNKLLRAAEQILEVEVESQREERLANAEAERRDRDERRKAELGERKKRLVADLAAAEQQRVGEEQAQLRKAERHQQDIRDQEASRRRKGERHAQELRERAKNLEDGSRERNMVVTLNAVGVLATIFFAACTVAFLFLTAKYAQPWGYAGSGIGLALTAILGLGRISQQFQTLFSLARSGGGKSDADGDKDD